MGYWELGTWNWELGLALFVIRVFVNRKSLLVQSAARSSLGTIPLCFTILILDDDCRQNHSGTRGIIWHWNTLQRSFLN